MSTALDVQYEVLDALDAAVPRWQDGAGEKARDHVDRLILLNAIRRFLENVPEDCTVQEILDALGSES